MTEAGFRQKPPGAPFMVLRNQHAARQNAERAFQDAHILVEHQRLNAGAFEQSYNCRNQDCVVCTDKFAHGTYVRLRQLEIRTATGVILTMQSLPTARLGWLRQSNALAASAQRSYACAFSAPETSFGRRPSI